MAGMELKGKRVLVVGAGRSGIAAARFLLGQGARVTVSDSRSASALAGELPGLMDAGISVETGGHGLLTFRRQDLIVVSPGVPLQTPEVARVRALGMPVIGELELASRFLEGQVIAITGSNGKTTTTALVGEILKHAGVPVQVGGNIGTPVVELIPGSGPETWNVLEVSSFQLETAETFRPRIAAVLNVTPDHLDRHGSYERYAAAKARITERQDAEDFLVLNGEDKGSQMMAAQRFDVAGRGERVAGRTTLAQIFWFSGRRPIKQGAFVHGESVVYLGREGGAAEPVMPVAEIGLRGAHNVENVLAAVTVARLAGVPAAAIREAVRNFKAVAHRLELVRERAGVQFFNDSKATNVDAAIKALESFAGGVHLILGGKDKNSDYRVLEPLVRTRVAVVYTIGSAAEKIREALGGVGKMVEAETLDRAVQAAAAAARPGEVVLLAPACASFDQFESYEHRGRVFRQLVEAL